MSRGTLRIYLGAAPGVGKTYAMLGEGRRRADRGTDVVIGIVETHGRPKTAAMIQGLELLPRKKIEYRGTSFEEMDVDAILARAPEVALVDELAHTNVPGCRNAKRWEDVEELLEAGIHVVSTVNIQHLESLNDVVERITGIVQRERIPDEIVRRADQIELVDMTPEALRRRMAHGNVYGPEKVNAALANYFRIGNLGALRELALLWVADQVDVALEAYRERHGIKEPWETRERVVVALTGAPGTEALIRRAARIAQRAHGELLGVHVISEEGLATPSGTVGQHRQLLIEMGGTYHEVAGADTAAALCDFALAENATQLVMGASRRSRLQEILHGSVISRVMRLSGSIDLHVIAHDPTSRAAVRRPGRRRLWSAGRPPSPLAPRRVAAGWVLGLGGVALLTAVLANLRSSVGLPTVLLLFLALAVITAVLGGRAPGLATAIVGSLAANWYFTPPFYELTIHDPENVVALLVFLGVAGAMSNFVLAAARRTAEANRARAEAQTLAALAATSRADDPLPVLVGAIQSAFALDAVAVLSKEDGGWRVEAAAGEPVPESPDQATLAEPLSADCVLALVGDRIAAEDRYVLNAFSDQLAAVLDRSRLEAEVGRVHGLAEANELRSALLQAVSNDLRNPLASIKAAGDSLDKEISSSPSDHDAFVDIIVEETDRLIAIVANLLDMSRLQVGALPPALAPVGVEEVTRVAVRSIGPRAAGVAVAIDDGLPAVEADPALLERALANVIDNAVRWSPPGRPVRVEAGAFGDRVDLRVVDQGPGIPPAMRPQAFTPFKPREDGDTGLGLGLAIALGFVQAMHGTVEIEDTPGGGTTVIISLRLADVGRNRDDDRVGAVEEPTL